MAKKIIIKREFVDTPFKEIKDEKEKNSDSEKEEDLESEIRESESENFQEFISGGKREAPVIADDTPVELEDTADTSSTTQTATPTQVAQPESQQVDYFSSGYEMIDQTGAGTRTMSSDEMVGVRTFDGENIPIQRTQRITSEDIEDFRRRTTGMSASSRNGQGQAEDYVIKAQQQAPEETGLPFERKDKKKRQF